MIMMSMVTMMIMMFLISMMTKMTSSFSMDCHKVPIEECIDELQETPFLVDTEKCEDVPKLVCTEVT